jgi:hypothetical protein
MNFVFFENDHYTTMMYNNENDVIMHHCFFENDHYTTMMHNDQNDAF